MHQIGSRVMSISEYRILVCMYSLGQYNVKPTDLRHPEHGLASCG